MVTTTLLAPAKVTLSLRVTGVRDDGYHLIDAEMVTVDLADELEVDPDGDHLEVVDEAGRGLPVVTGDDNLVAGALRLAGRTAGVTLTKRHPRRGRPRRWFRRRRGRAAVGRLRRPRGCRRASAPTSPSASWVAGPGCRGSARSSTRCVRGPHPHAAHAAVRLLDAGGVPRLGRPGRTDGGRTERPRAGGARRRAPAGGVARPARRRHRAARRCSPAAARPGSSRARSRTWRGPSSSARSRPSSGPAEGGAPDAPPVAGGRRRVRGLLAGAALPAGALQHLLVLLLAHALAALLDQRSHEGGDATGMRYNGSNPSGIVQLAERRPLEPNVGGSSPPPRA